MTRYAGAVLAALLLAAAFAGPAAAEITLPVNDNNTGIFDQPSAVLDDTAVRVAFIGDASGSGVYKVYIASVDGNFDFVRTTFPSDNAYRLTNATAVDNSTSPNDAYYDARHPKILMRTSTHEAVILFQAKESSGATVYRPYLARVALTGSTITTISVKKITGFPTSPVDLSTSDIEDISFGIVTTDNVAHIAFCTKSAIGASESFQVYFARVLLGDATVTGTPVLLSSITNTGGLRPLPSLKLDSSNRAHIAWVANNSTPVTSPVYYALVKEQPAGNPDNNVIQATQVIATPGIRWGFPITLVYSPSSVVILAADETVSGQAGNLGIVNINPDADDQDGDPAFTADARTFFLSPLGEAIIADGIRLYHPDAFLDSAGKIHLAGYGIDNVFGDYGAIILTTSSPYYDFQPSMVSWGGGTTEYPKELSGDYTRAAFVYMPSAGKVVIFWSGEIGTNRNLDVTTAKTSSIVTPAQESGCSMVAYPGSGENGRMAGAAILFLPAVVLGVRRISRRSRMARGRDVV
ncbi:MAG: hypothetical protein HY896_13315 [Deltaproteobacteria bacterium]|nr:hypothetical protein [Deltaproteobacteria bacterium]